MTLKLETVKNWIRIEHEEDDGILELLIEASHSFIESYLNRSLDSFEGGYPKEIDVAKLYVVQQWYDQAAITSFTKGEKAGLDFAFSMLLDRHRFKKFAFAGYPKLDTENYEFGYSVNTTGSIDIDSDQVDTYKALKGFRGGRLDG